MNSNVGQGTGQILLLLPLGILLFFVPVSAQDSTQHKVDVDFKYTLHCLEVKSGPDAWYGDDKIRHLVGSMFSTTLLTQLAYRESRWNNKEIKVIAVGTTLGLGFVKELYDRSKPGNHFCWKDIVADAGGILIGLVLLGIK